MGTALMQTPAMFKSARWKITLAFCLISSFVCVTVGSVAAAVLYRGLTESIDQELQALSAEILQFIDLRDPAPDLIVWATRTQNTTLKYMASVKVVDISGRIIEQHGPTNIPIVNAAVNEVTAAGEIFRVRTQELTDAGGHQVGLLQVAVSTRNREEAVKQLRRMIMALAPILAMALLGAGYIFSSAVLKPIEQAYEAARRHMADASHELKTPVTIIRANAEAIEDSVSGQPQIQRKLDAINRATERMQKLIDDLAVLSKLENPLLRAPSNKVDLSGICKSLMDDFAIRYESKGLKLESAIDQGLLVQGDSDALRRAISNLLENALRYTDSGGVSLTAQQSGRQVLIKVADSGLGIAPEHKDKIFDRFYRVEESRSRAEGGSGLGLAIVKTIAENHKGSVSLSSAPGSGSTFVISIPSA